LSMTCHRRTRRWFTSMSLKHIAAEPETNQPAMWPVRTWPASFTPRVPQASPGQLHSARAINRLVVNTDFDAVGVLPMWWRRYRDGSLTPRHGKYGERC
jgi:hypothetical protein